MNNEEFINTFQLCGRLDGLSKKDIQELMDCKIDLIPYYKDVIRYVNINNTGLSNEVVILKTFSDVLMFYKREDRTQLECFEEFVDLLKLKLKVFNDENIISNIIGSGGSLGSSHLLRDLRLFRIRELQKDSLLYLKDKIVRCSTSINDDGTTTFIIDGVQTNIGMILLINEEEKYIKVSDKHDGEKILKILLRDDFDLAIVPPLSFLDNDFYRINNISDMSNAEYLEYLELSSHEGKTLNTVKKIYYANVADYDIDLKDILKLATMIGPIRISKIVNITSAVISKMNGLEKGAREEYIKEVYQVLDTESMMIRPSNLQWYWTDRLDDLSDMFRDKRLSLEECMDNLKREKCKNVDKLVSYGMICSEKYKIDKNGQIQLIENGNVYIIENFCAIINREHKIKIVNKKKEKDLYEMLKKQKDYILILESD